MATYRVDEAIALVARDAVFDASMQEGPHKQYFACITSHLTPAAFSSVAEETVRENFPDRARLRDATEFFETPTGIRLRDMVIEALKQRPMRRYAGKPIDQPGDYPMTTAEHARLVDFEKLPAFQDFRRFREAMGAIGLSPRMVGPLKQIQAGCSPNR